MAEEMDSADDRYNRWLRGDRKGPPGDVGPEKEREETPEQIDRYTRWLRGNKLPIGIRAPEGGYPPDPAQPPEQPLPPSPPAGPPAPAPQTPFQPSPPPPEPGTVPPQQLMQQGVQEAQPQPASQPPQGKTLGDQMRARPGEVDFQSKPASLGIPGSPKSPAMEAPPEVNAFRMKRYELENFVRSEGQQYVTKVNEDGEKEYQENLPPRVDQAIKLLRAREFEEKEQKGGEERGDIGIRNAIPYASAKLKVEEARVYALAKQRLLEGKPERDDYYEIAKYEQRRENIAKEGFGTRVLRGAAPLSAMAGEMIAPAKILKAAGMIGSKLVGQAVTGSIKAALSPSMVVDEMIENNLAADRMPDDPRGIPGAMSNAAIAGAVLGSLGSVAEGVGGKGAIGFMKRNLARGAVGVVEQSAADAVSGAVGLKNGYGSLIDLAKGTKTGEDALADVASLMIINTGMAAFHDSGHKPAAGDAVLPKGAEKLLDQFNGTLNNYFEKGVSRDNAAAEIKPIADLAQQARDRGLTPEEGKKLFKDVADPDLKKLGEAIAETLPEKRPPAEPQEAPPAPPSPQTDVQGTTEPTKAPEAKPAPEKGIARKAFGEGVPEAGTEWAHTGTKFHDTEGGDTTFKGPGDKEYTISGQMGEGKVSGKPYVEVVVKDKEGKELGYVKFDKSEDASGQTVSAANIRVAEELRSKENTETRRAVVDAMHDFMAEESGQEGHDMSGKLVSSKDLSKGGESVYKRNREFSEAMKKATEEEKARQSGQKEGQKPDKDVPKNVGSELVAKKSPLDRMRERMGSMTSEQLEAMRRNAGNPLPTQQAVEGRQDPRGMIDTTSNAGAIGLLGRASDQARQLREQRAKFTEETAPGGQDPIQHPEQSEADWADNVITNRVERFKSIVQDAFSDPTPERLNVVADVVARLDNMARGRGLDTTHLIKERMPELYERLGPDTVKELIEAGKELASATADAIDTGKRFGIEPSSVRSQIIDRLYRESQAAQASTTHEATQKPAEGADGPGGGAPGSGQAAGDQLSPGGVENAFNGPVGSENWTGLQRATWKRTKNPVLKNVLQNRYNGVKTLYDVVMDHTKGKGLDPTSLGDAGKVALKILKENGLPDQLFKKGGADAWSLSEMLQSGGWLSEPPKDTHLPEHLLNEILKGQVADWGATGHEELLKQEEAYHKELQDARQDPSITPSEIEEAIRSGQEDGEAEARSSKAGELIQPSGERGDSATERGEGSRIEEVEPGVHFSQPVGGNLKRRGAEPVAGEPGVRPEQPAGGGGPGGGEPGAGGPGGAEPPGGTPSGAAAADGGGRPEPILIDQPVERRGGIWDSVKRLFSPMNRDADSQTAGGILRQNGAELARRDEMAKKATMQARELLDDYVVRAGNKDLVRDRFLEVTDAVEGRTDAADLPDGVRQAAQMIRKLLDSRKEQLKDRGLVKTFIDDYFGHLWADPTNADREGSSLGREFGNRSLTGSESFRRHREIPTYRDGIERGLEPRSWNPIELGLANLHQIDKCILGRDSFNELKERGLLKFVPSGQRPPDGWTRFDDKLSSVFAPPFITMKEYYDKSQIEGLEQVAAKLGVPIETVTRGLGGAAGMSETGGKVSRYVGSPEEVLAHEIGHQLEDKYKLSSFLNQGAMKAELSNLAEQRYRGENPSGEYRAYADTPHEKIANLVAAFMHAPDLLNRVAPETAKEFKKFLAGTPELAGLSNVEPSLVLGSRPVQVDTLGPQKVGDYYGPETVTTLINNHLSSGFRGQPWFDAIRGIGNSLNMYNLGLSAYHATTEAFQTQINAVALATQQISRGQIGKGAVNLAKGMTPGAPLIEALWTGSKMLKEYYKPGSQGGEVAKYVENYVKGGGRVTVDDFYHSNAIAGFREAWKDMKGKWTDESFQDMKMAKLGFDAVAEAISYPIMQLLVPRLKAGSFAQMSKFHMERLGDMAPVEKQREAFGRSVDSVDNRMGQLVYDNVFMNRMLKDGMMIGIRSVGWNLGTIRELAGGVKDVPKSFMQTIRGDGITERTAYAFAMPVVTAFYGGILHYLMTGKKPEDYRDYIAPQTGNKRADGTPERMMMLGYVKDVAHLLNRADEGPARIGGNALEMAKGKINPFPALVGDVLMNQDFHGTALRNPNDPWVKQYEDLTNHILKSMMPISMQELSNKQQKNKIGAAAKGFFGIADAPSYVRRTWKEQRAIEAKNKVVSSPLQKKKREDARK